MTEEHYVDCEGCDERYSGVPAIAKADSLANAFPSAYRAW